MASLFPAPACWETFNFHLKRHLQLPGFPLRGFMPQVPAQTCLACEMWWNHTPRQCSCKRFFISFIYVAWHWVIIIIKRSALGTYTRRPLDTSSTAVQADKNQANYIVVNFFKEKKINRPATVLTSDKSSTSNVHDLTVHLHGTNLKPSGFVLNLPP